MEAGALKVEEKTAVKGKKFGLLSISNLGHSFGENQKIAFDDDVTLHLSSNSHSITDHFEDTVWRNWVGLEWERIKGANAMLEISKASEQPDIQDHENKELEDKAFTLWFALKLVAPIHTDGAYITSGSYKDNKIAVRSYKKMPPWILPPQKNFYVWVDQAVIAKWQSLYMTIISLKMEAKAGKYARLFRGLRTFEKGCLEFYLEYRLPFFVRAVEALILPDKGDTKRKFKSRASRWWPKDWDRETFPANSHEILGEIYDIRCDFDHLHGLKEDYTDKQNLRGYQCEQLARKTYQSILLSDELKNFDTDEHILSYWAQIEKAIQKPDFVPNPNPDRSFGGGKYYRDVVKMSFEDSVRSFDGRIKDWFLNPANPQVQKDNNGSIPNGFQVTQACCIVIDVLTQYTNDLASSHSKEYIEFLKTLDPLFTGTIDPPIESWTWGFDKAGTQIAKPEKIETLAQGFYHAFRCGIVHGAMIRDYGRITGDREKAPNVIQLRTWGHSVKEREIAVNPTLLFGIVVKRFDQYISDLSNKKNQSLRQKFSGKFYKDFGIILNWT